MQLLQRIALPEPRGADSSSRGSREQIAAARAKVLATVRREQVVVDEALHRLSPAFVITAGGKRRVHKPNCYHVAHALDREKAWHFVLSHVQRADTDWDTGFVYAMPQILGRDEVEQLPSYVACQACAPTLNSQQKIWKGPLKPMAETSLGLHHIGRELFTAEKEALGILVSYEKKVSCAGLQTVVITSTQTIESDGSAKFIVAPKDG